MKAELFRKVGQPERGFSVVMRAASVCFRARLGTGLWGAVGGLANILNSLGEYVSAKRLSEAVLPQALEGGDNLLIGTLYSHLADAYMGLADPALTSSSDTKSSSNLHVAKAELYIDHARERYKRAGYVVGECEQVMKRAVIARLRGDGGVAEVWAQRYGRVWEEGMGGGE